MGLVFIAIQDSQGKLRKELRLFASIWVTISIFDSWLTANHVAGFGSLKEPFNQLFPLIFVLLGDFRYFYWSEGLEQNQWSPQVRRLALAALWTLIVPVLSKLILMGLPSPHAENSRILFLVYEALFVGIALLHFNQKLKSQNLKSDQLDWFKSVRSYVVTYYSLWATADLWILSCEWLSASSSLRDFGFLLRVFPNVLYYGGLIPWIVTYPTRSSFTQKT